MNRAVTDDQRFAFGANWLRFLSTVGETQVRGAEDSLRARLRTRQLSGRSFVDVGSGSGLFSLAARRLGATVYSFDYDAQSVACTQQLKERFLLDDTAWMVAQGSILDQAYLQHLGQFDVVYSWGVLHHTGDLWQALHNIAYLVRPGGYLFIAIYNDQGWISRYWTVVKRLYNRGALSRILVVAVHLPYLFLGRFFARLVTRRLMLERGMSLWYDMHDWLGGYPFEVATPHEIEAYYAKRGFSLFNAVTCGRKPGCNEFVFVRAADVVSA